MSWKATAVMQRWKLIAFAVFLIVDLLLVGYVIQQYRADQVPTASDGPKPSGGDVETLGGPATGDLRADAKGGNAVVRWRMGSCASPGRPLLEVSVNGGRSFEERAVPVLEASNDTDPGSRAKPVRTILAVEPESADKLRVVAGDEDCRAVLYTTENGGDSWNRQVSLDAWYVDATSEAVFSPTGTSKSGCTITSLSPISDTEAVMTCSGGLILSTIDAGEAWTQSGDLNRDVEAAVFVSRRTGFAIAKDTQCARTFMTTDGGVTWVPAGCVDNMEVAALTGTANWLVALDRTTVRVSTDQGKTWIDP